MTDPLDVTQLALLGEAADCLEDVGVFVWARTATTSPSTGRIHPVTGKTRVAGRPYLVSLCWRAP